jgi:universal protein Kae1
VIALGIEGTAHTASVGIVTESGEILSNVSSSISSESEGIHPRVAANHHADAFPNLIKKALHDANIGLNDIDIIGYSKGPGLGPCLRTTVTSARALAIHIGKPIIGVNHCIAHIEIGRMLCKVNDPLILYVSGGNTQIIYYSLNRYRIVGETIDIGIGNFFDKLGREMDMKFPSGPKIEELAKKGNKLLDLPYTVKGMDVAFSGLLTSLKSYIEKGEKYENICYSAQEYAFSMLTEVTERTVSYLDNREVLIVGGVARNQLLFEKIRKMVSLHSGKVYSPPGQYCSDNGAMIAWASILNYKNSSIFDDATNASIDPRYRTDHVVVNWR